MSSLQLASQTNAGFDVRRHFSLRLVPFTREIKTAERWRNEAHEQELQGLRHTIEQRMSAALIAPPGSGKTNMLRALKDSLPDARYRLHYVMVTGLGKRDFCREISRALGCSPAGRYDALVHQIQERCVTLADEQSLRPVLFIDEAHDLRPDVLSILRVITNFEMDSKLVVSLILAGQSGLRDLLRRAELEAVSCRLAHFATLRPLSRAESREYIEHRLKIAGARSSLFDPHAQDALFECAQGNLRALSRLALKSLEEGAKMGVPVIGAEIVAAARARITP